MCSSSATADFLNPCLLYQIDLLFFLKAFKLSELVSVIEMQLLFGWVSDPIILSPRVRIRTDDVWAEDFHWNATPTHWKKCFVCITKRPFLLGT